MKQNNLGRFLLVVAIILWSLYEVFPPTARDLLQEFSTRAQNPDGTFKGIVEQAQSLTKQGTDTYFAIQQAVGTNDLRKYFPDIPAQNQVNPNQFILNRIQRDSLGRIKLGLDLQGGTAFLMEMDTTNLDSVVTRTNDAGHLETITNHADLSGALSQAIEVLRKRVDRFGVAEPLLQSAGGNRILIQLPGLSQAAKAQAEETLKKAAFLEFRMVHDHSAEIIDENTGETRETIPFGYEVLKRIEQQANGKSQIEAVVVKKTAENGLQGDIIQGAWMGRDSMGAPIVEFTLTSEGGKRFGETTRKYSPDPQTGLKHRLAIILDKELYSAPQINGPIETGSGMIEGHFTTDQALQLANVLQNPLKASLRLASSKDVAATLGADSIKSGVNASIWGVVFVAGFMLIYYRLAGLTANIALITNIVILLGVMCAVGTTFTLPGIAGGVLTVGMAVDANVLIYERIREELAKGKSLRGAIDAGYARAFGTIFDSHVTTLISSIILIWKGTGEIQGFGVTLTIGVAASLFTALVVTRLIFNFLLDRGMISSLKMFHLIRATNVNFMGAAKGLFFASWLFIVASLVFGGFQGVKLFGVDFRGGDSLTYKLTQKANDSEISTMQKGVRDVLTAIGEKDAQIQYQKETGTGTETFSIVTSIGSTDKVKAAIAGKLPQEKLHFEGSSSVGATLGAEIVESAVVALALAMFGILVYVAFRYEFSFAVAAVIAVFHDVLFAIGAYCIANATSGRQFNATVVAALLTIIGFSINDKIVIFDRIREDLKLGMRGTFREIINQALNQTLSRTIITSGTVFLATMSLYLFGGGVINDFAFTFLVGIVVGTYSSIYVASVIVLWWHKGERPEIGASQVKVQEVAAAKTAKV